MQSSPLSQANQDITAGKKFYKSYKRFFNQVTGFEPLPFQVAFAKSKSEHGYRALSVPTGLGKSLTILCDWLYRRVHDPSNTPRRLFYVLPLRTLVTQLTDVCKEVTEKAGLDVPVYTLMGGKIENDFIEKPEEPAIIISTVDQLVSSQLVRPYMMSVKSSLMAFAATNDDVQIVLDESQLCEEGLYTSIALHELFLECPSFHNRELVLCSATNDTSAVDRKKFDFVETTLSRSDYRHPIAGAKVNNQKSLEIHMKMTDEELADLVLDNHKDGELSLVIVNTVKRSQSVYKLLDVKDKMLVHSRFRRADRNKLEKKLPDFKGIVVATSCIEAGVDISAENLFTEVCPWSSLVQRAGRCARLPNTTGKVFVIDTNSPLPYSNGELDSTRDRLNGLKDMSIKSLMSVPPVANPNKKPTIDLHLIKRLFDVSNTEPISHHVRVVSNPTCFVGWRYPRHLSADMRKADPLELCPIYPNQVLNLINGRKDAWILDEEATAKQRPFKPVWKKFDFSVDKVEPGMTFIVGTASKKYSKELGFIDHCKDRVNEIYDLSPKPSSSRGSYANAKNKSLGLVAHLADTANFARTIVKDINLHFGDFNDAVVLASYLHDWGKASHVFQASLIDFSDTEQRDVEVPLAKGDQYKKWEGGAAYFRRGFRHEVPSALALLELGSEDSLVTFLVMSHHGQITSHLRSMRDNVDTEKSICGVYEGDIIHPIRGQWRRDIKKPSYIKLTKGYMTPRVVFKNPNDYVRQYRDAFNECWDSYGPIVMAYLHSLVRIADHRASSFRSPCDIDEV